MSKCGKNKKVAHEPLHECVTGVLSLPHFDIFYDLLLNRLTATWNLLFCFIQLRSEKVRSGAIYASVLQ